MNAVNRRSGSISIYLYIIYERQRSKIYFESWIKILAQIRFRIQHNILLRSAGIIPQDLACRENTFCWAKVYTKILSTLFGKCILLCCWNTFWHAKKNTHSALHKFARRAVSQGNPTFLCKSKLALILWASLCTTCLFHNMIYMRKKHARTLSWKHMQVPMFQLSYRFTM